MKIIYRISDAGYNKVKPDYIDNEKCLQNFCNVFYDHIYDITCVRRSARGHPQGT